MRGLQLEGKVINGNNESAEESEHLSNNADEYATVSKQQQPQQSRGRHRSSSRKSTTSRHRARSNSPAASNSSKRHQQRDNAVTLPRSNGRPV